jgi:hypothetical protein
MGQILGFLSALDKWRSELCEYDVLIRSRWDMLLDASVLAILARDHSQGHTRRFYTKSLSVINGQGSISGDVIYGSAQSWLELLPSKDTALDRLIQQCRRQHRVYAQLYPDKPTDLNGYWFNSHSLWYMLFQDQPFDLVAAGESMKTNTVVTRPADTRSLGEFNQVRRQQLYQDISRQISEDQTSSPPRLFKN